MALKEVSIKDFSGGLNVVENDLNLSTKYTRVEENVITDVDGSKRIRYGTKEFVDLSSMPDIVHELSYVWWNSGESFLHIRDIDFGFPIYSPIVISGISGTVGDWSDSNINGSRIILRDDTTDSFLIEMPSAATTTGYLDSLDFTVTFSNNKIDPLSRIIGMEYFQNSLISVSSRGQVLATQFDSSGTAYTVVIWDSTIAQAYMDNVSGISNVRWFYNTDDDYQSEGDFVSFEKFGGQLLLTNGQNKPLVVDLTYNAGFVGEYSFPCFPLQNDDKGNLYVPICKYFTTCNNYLCAAGFVKNIQHVSYREDLLMISASGNSSLWSDFQTTDSPSAATYYDEDAVTAGSAAIYTGIMVSSDDASITALSRFRDKLLVYFGNRVLAGTLGVYINEYHSPEFDDAIFDVGTFSSKSIKNLSEKIVSLDAIGVPNIHVTQFSSTFIPDRSSANIDPLIQESLLNLSQYTIENYVFSINDPKKYQYMLFIPNGNPNDTVSDWTNSTEYYVGDIVTDGTYNYRVLSDHTTDEDSSFADYYANNSNFYVNIYDSDYDVNKYTETKVFVYSYNPNLKNPVWTTFRGWNFDCACTTMQQRVLFGKGSKIYKYASDSDKYYADYIPADGSSEGTNINFTWTLPWKDFGVRQTSKKTKYIHIDTVGTGRFTVNMYVDNFYGERYNGVENYIQQPELSMDFVGGSQLGFGGAGQSFGGGRIASNEKLIAWTSKFNIAKFEITGSTNRLISWLSLVIMIDIGSIRR